MYLNAHCRGATELQKWERVETMVGQYQDAMVLHNWDDRTVGKTLKGLKVGRWNFYWTRNITGCEAQKYVDNIQQRVIIKYCTFIMLCSVNI